MGWILQHAAPPEGRHPAMQEFLKQQLQTELQVVFATKVFEGNAGPPQILASHVW
jgi:hypothetical protein